MGLDRGSTIGTATRPQRATSAEGYAYADQVQAEYLALQNFYEDYDRRALSLKALATPLLGIGVAAGFKDGSVGVLGATVAIALCLWVLEAVWKSFQRRHARRIIRIERCYARDKPWEVGAPFQIYRSWIKGGARYRTSPRLWLRLFLAPFVMLPYAVIVALAVIGAAGILVDRANRTSGSTVAEAHRTADVPPVMPAGPVDRAGLTDNPTATTERDRQAEEAARATATPSGSLWLVVIVGAATIGVGIWLASLLALRARLLTTDDREAATDARLATTAKQALGITAVGALTAVATAMAAVGKVADGWKLALPLLIAPAAIVFAALYTGTRRHKWWAFGIGLALSLATVVAHLIDPTVRGDPALWWPSFQSNAGMLLSKLSFADGSALSVALLAYFVALFGASGTGKPAAVAASGSTTPA